MLSTVLLIKPILALLLLIVLWKSSIEILKNLCIVCVENTILQQNNSILNLSTVLICSFAMSDLKLALLQRSSFTPVCKSKTNVNLIILDDKTDKFNNSFKTSSFLACYIQTNMLESGKTTLYWLWLLGRTSK